jgi:acyl-CoA dehydrogenase
MSEDLEQLRASVRGLCKSFPLDYWKDLDVSDGFPEAFLKAFTEAGFVQTLIPEAYGGLGLGLTDASVILEEIHRSGADGGICQTAMNTLSVLVRHGSEALKTTWLPKVASGEVRFIAFAVTEADAGTDTTRIRTTARRVGDRYIVNGTKLWISRAEQTDLMVLLVRTSPRDEHRKTEGLSILLVDMREARGSSIRVTPVKTMVNHNSTEIAFDNLEVPAGNLIGEEGKGFRYIIDGMNAERILIGAECIGDARWFVETASEQAKTRQVFGRFIGQNQGVQFPLAEAHARNFAAGLAIQRAAALFDAGQPCGPEANMAKFLASEASWHAGDVCLEVHGGMGMAVDAHVERKFRESRLYRIAPVSNNLVLSFVAERVLGLPRSF